MCPSILRPHRYAQDCVPIRFDRNKRCLLYTSSEGGISATYVDVRLILQSALLANATQVILAHNHPSGSMKPSTLDDVLTEKVKKAAELMEIHIADHIILSLFEEGILAAADLEVTRTQLLQKRTHSRTVP